MDQLQPVVQEEQEQQEQQEQHVEQEEQSEQEEQLEQEEQEQVEQEQEVEEVDGEEIKEQKPEVLEEASVTCQLVPQQKCEVVDVERCREKPVCVEMVRTVRRTLCPDSENLPDQHKSP